MNPTPAPYRFHGFDVSYFSAKVRPALRYKQLWYEELRADIREIIRRTGMHYIPILVTPEDETWQDSTEILEKLEERHPEPPLFPGTPLQRMACHLVELYVDEFGIVPAMHTRWGSELGASSSRARFCAMTGSEKQGNLAADQMMAGRLAVGASDEAAPAIEAHTRDLLDALSTHFEAHSYLLGERMSFGDCALMGMLYAHLFVDLPSRRLLLETAVPTVSWIERASYPNTDSQGEWLPDDALAPTMRAVLGAMGRDAVPAILADLGGFEDWADSRPAELPEWPRAVGRLEVPLRGRPLTRRIGTYGLWNVARVLDRYWALPDPDRKQVDESVVGTGWEELLAYEPRHRLTKRGFALEFA